MPAGRHELRMRYDPVSVRLGGLVSAITGAAAAVAGMLLVATPRGRGGVGRVTVPGPVGAGPG